MDERASVPLPKVAVVLAAGRSERLSSVTGGGSKALLRLSGVPLVERAVRSLLRKGVERVVVVVGYQAGPVAAVVKRIAPGHVRTVLARDWKNGNGASLAAAERLVKGEELFLLVTMDHVFSDEALYPLIRAGVPSVLVDDSPHADVWAEGTRVRIRRRKALAFSKKLTERPVDCGAFLLHHDVFDWVRRAADNDDYSLAGVMTLLAQTQPLRAVPLPAGAWWQDVDTPADLRAARGRLRSSLVKRGDGPVSRYLNRPVSTRISMLIAPLGLSPDAVSLLSAAVGIVGAFLLASGAAVAGALAVHACSVLDGVDGEVARLQLKESGRGALLDGILDRLTDAAIVAGLAFWALRSGATEHSTMLFAVGATAFSILSMASKDRISSLGLLPAPERTLGWLLGGRDGRLLLIAVFALFGKPVLALALVTATSGATLLLRLFAVLLRER
jgi:1L-myo-inositol 1-phosphate cytidylyltransferase / CDP-L-myo-inositol myo-inositolphosphotransferase